MSIQHRLLTGADLHEPKGVASAASGRVYVANGSGSGTWAKLTIANVDAAAITTGDYVYVNAGALTGVTLNNANLITLNCYMSNAANVEDAWVVCPIDGTILNIWSTTYDAADATTIITPSIAGVNLTSGAITISSTGAAAGDVDSCTPSANNDILAGQTLRLLSDGGATAALPVMFTILIDVAD